MNCASIIEALELSSLSQVPLCSLLAEDGVCGLKCLDSESLCFAKHRFLAPSSTVKSVFSADLLFLPPPSPGCNSNKEFKLSQLWLDVVAMRRQAGTKDSCWEFQGNIV